MIQAAYTAKQGIAAQQQRVDTIAHNIANISTHGFKSRRVDFKDALYAQLNDPANPQSTLNLQQGHGVLASATSRDFTQGAPMNTGQTLDMFIDGNGFFEVKGSDGITKYTRNGCFQISNEPDGKYLMTPQGYYVLDARNERILIPGNIEDLTVGQDGVMSIGQNTMFAKLSLVEFANQDGLASVGQNLYTQTAASGAPVASDTTIRQGVLEASNVDLALELTSLIRAQRAFSMAGSALSSADNMDALANRLR